MNTCLRYQTQIWKSSVAGHSNMRLSPSLSVFDWLHILWGNDHSLILLLKEYYITVQRKIIRTGKKRERENMIFK